MLGAGDTDIGRAEENVEPGPGSPAVDRGDDRLPDARVVIAHAPVDPALLPVHGAGERPVDAVGAQILAVLGRQVGARGEVVAAAEMPVAGTVHGQKSGVDGRMGDHYPRVWKPVIAAVNGWAAGAGLYILLSSTDIRIASAEHARFKFALLTQGWLGNGPGASLLVKQLRY